MKCKLCGKEFTPEHWRRLYCSEECSAQAKRINDLRWWRKAHNYEPPGKKVCSVCGAEFVPKTATQEACSRECCSRLRNIKKYCNGLTGEAREEYKRQRREANAKPPKVSTWFTGTCKVCGKEFRTLNPKQVTCSKECSKKLKYARKQHRIPKEQTIDKDITLEALYRRDSGVCYLCGGLCDWNDRDAENNIVGDSYPSIDHVIPVARGGLHAWNNVRLAHFKCNWEKGAELIEKAEDLIPDNAYEFKRESRPAGKEVYQYDAAGNLVAVYPSTAQAERETGIKQKGIQKCARGERKTCGGFVWKYMGDMTLSST